MKKRVDKKYSPEFKGTLLVLLTAIISGISIVVNKFFVVKIDPLLFTALRAFFIGFVFLIISIYVSKKTKSKFKKSSWKSLFLIGLTGGSFAFWLFFAGLKITTAGRAAFIHKTLPIYATILALIFLKEKISKKQVIALFIMLAGLLLMEISKLGNSIRTGDILILGATILWAVENTLAKKAMNKNESNWIVTFSRMFFGSLILFAVIIFTNKYNLLFSLTSQQIIYSIVSGIFLLSYVLTYYWGLKYINLSKAAAILLISPVISLFLGIFWLNEKVFFFQIIGSLLILIGAFFIVKVKSNKIKENFI